MRDDRYRAKDRLNITLETDALRAPLSVTVYAD